MANRKVLLGVFAHPDDESFGSGGTLARYADEGVAVHVIIATDGVAGSVEQSSGVASGPSLLQVRSGELSNAAVALGIASIWSLPYRDSGMRGTPENQHPQAFVQQPLECVVQELLGYMQRLQPQVVITHDPYGGYGHPDHIRCCEAVTAAFHLAQSPQKLYYSAFEQRLLKIAIRLLRLRGMDPAALGRNKDINLVEIASWDKPIHARVHIAAALDKKVRASQAHVSQYSGGPTFLRVIPKFIRNYVQRYEFYTRAVPILEGRVEDDLFAGV